MSAWVTALLAPLQPGVLPAPSVKTMPRCSLSGHAWCDLGSRYRRESLGRPAWLSELDSLWAALALEAPSQREERLRRRERVALGVVRPVHR